MKCCRNANATTSRCCDRIIEPHEKKEVGTKIDVVALTNLPFLIEQTAVDDDVHKQREAILTKSAVIGIPQSSPVGLDAITLQMVSVGIHSEGHRGDAVIVEELIVGKGELLPSDGIVGIGRLLVKSFIGQFCSLMLWNNKPVHRHDGVKQGRVNRRLEVPIEQHIHEDITVVIGFFG